MNRRLLLKSLLVFLFASLATSQPTDLVISALVDGPTFSLVELTACSYIPDFYPYEFTAHSSTGGFNGYYDDDFDPDVHTGGFPAGSYIYLATHYGPRFENPFTTPPPI
jgi:hypothetical protein